jgi:hypothetical protein
MREKSIILTRLCFLTCTLIRGRSGTESGGGIIVGPGGPYSPGVSHAIAAIACLVPTEARPSPAASRTASASELSVPLHGQPQPHWPAPLPPYPSPSGHNPWPIPAPPPGNWFKQVAEHKI